MLWVAMRKGQNSGIQDRLWIMAGSDWPLPFE